MTSEKLDGWKMKMIQGLLGSGCIGSSMTVGAICSNASSKVCAEAKTEMK